MGAIDTSSRHAVLLFSDVVGSTAIKARLGTAAYKPLLSRHNELFERLIAEFPGAEILKHTGDGYFASFTTASDAVRFALLFQQSLRAENWGAQAVCSRIGIHSGEVAIMEMAGKRDVVGLAADIAARVMSAGGGGQILMTRGSFDDARQFVAEHPVMNGDAARPVLRWEAHGRYAFDGSDEPLEIFEVGAESASPLAPPADTSKARRIVPHDQEQTLGWRPAIGLEVPHRVGWILDRKLGEGGFGEVWLGKHEKAGTRRVFKFCFDVDRLRSFKRELTLFKLLREVLGERPDIARLYEVHFKDPPYFLESEYTDGGNLMEWADNQGGIASIPLERRLKIVAQVATATAAAHSVGVLHKDIKPANILIHRTGNEIQPRLADFGIGFLSDRSELDKRAITASGFTNVTEGSSSKTSTLMYAPPELLAGMPFTVQGDVYGLGVLLFQMVVGDLKRPLASGWERDVHDELLRQDIADCVDGEPARRLPTAQALSERLEKLEHRREHKRLEAQALIDAEQVHLRRAEAERLAQRRRVQVRLMGTATAAMFVVLIVIGVLLHRTRQMQILAEKNEQMAHERHIEADRHAKRALKALVSMHVRDGFERIEDGRPAWGLLWLAQALQMDQADAESQRLHRMRFNVALQHIPRLLDLPQPPPTAEGTLLERAEQEGDYHIVSVPRPHRSPIKLYYSFVPATQHTSKTDRLIVATDRRGGIHALQIDTNNSITPSLRLEKRVRDARFSADERMIVGRCEDDSTYVWEANLPSALGDEHKSDAWHAVFSPDGSRFATCSSDGSAWVWDTSMRRPVTRVAHEANVWDVNFSPDGSKIVTSSEDGTARIWDAASGQPIGAAMKHDDEVHYALFSPDGRLVATAGYDGVARLWDAGSGKPIGEPMRHEDKVQFICFSPDGLRVATGSSDGTARIWEATTGKPLTPPMEHQAEVRWLCFSPDGNLLAAASRNATAGLWNVHTGELITIVQHDSTVYHVNFSPDGKTLITASADGYVRRFDVENKKSSGRPVHHDDKAWCANFSADGRMLVTASRDGTAKIIDASTGEQLLPPLRHRTEVYDARFSPDGTRILTACQDGSVWLWDIRQDERPIADLVKLAELLSGRAITQDPRTAPLPPVGWQQRWDELRRAYPDQFQPAIPNANEPQGSDS